MAEPGFRLEHDGPIDWLTLDDGSRLNGLTETMVAEMTRYFTALAHGDVRIVVIRGANGGFCAGLDLKAPLPALDADPGEGMRFMSVFGGLILAMRSAPQVVIALLEGAVAGGGMAIALAADLRYAAPDMRMTPAFTRLGLSGAEMGLSYLLPRVIGAGRASEILLTGRSVDADEALATGLVSAVVTSGLEAHARRVSSDMLRATPLALRLTKEAITLGLDADLDGAIATENRNQTLCFQSRAPREGVNAFLQKRPADF